MNGGIIKTIITRMNLNSIPFFFATGVIYILQSLIARFNTERFIANSSYTFSDYYACKTIAFTERIIANISYAIRYC